MHTTTSNAGATTHKQNNTARRLFHFRRPKFRGIGKRKSAVIEVALSPVKYGALAALGYTTLRWVSHIDNPTCTVSMHARTGFLGGIVLVIPFLIRLLLTSETEPEASENILRDQATLIVKEAFYSAVSAYIGCLVISMPGRFAVSMMVVGAAGAFTSFVILYVTLGVILGLLWLTSHGLSYCGARQRRLDS